MSLTTMHKTLLKLFNNQRNLLIEDFRSFKRNRVNRAYMPHSAFDATLKEFRNRISEMDAYIRGTKLARTVTIQTGLLHFYDGTTGSIYNPDSIENYLK